MQIFNETNFQKSVRDIILKKRRDLGKTQENIGEAIDADSSFIGQIERGQKSYNLNHINKIAMYLGCSPQDLIPQTVIKENNNVR